ncbi:stage V sporulation protein AC [Paenibacillus sp. J31TS4]|uniref:stage V sporulation protein AC n=1 Tax=Paenibacillus sp. J31TS4 TaxID=2807195 RepID=UPI001AFF6436|nr:stage V sporulation protein AC [Paenibacillus sp. J31TS4]GIP39540.1 stage V sporulation protein AC [Paenibacillus sp. J31TS4]
MAMKSKMMMPVQKEYQELAKQKEPARPVLSNCIRAFLVGGVICLIGEGLMLFYQRVGGFSEKAASSPTVVTLILISVLLTSFGLYDKIAQWAGAGTAVPVTGFANSMCSAAIEHKSEGLVLGVGGNMFKLAGSVIVFGTVAAFLIGIIHVLFKLGG